MTKAVAEDKCFISFKEDISGFALPIKFNYPFYYDPHPLCILAAKQLQNYLTTQSDWEHNFGLDDKQEGLVIGKMFGVLVVQNKDNELGFLTAFSGKLAGGNHHKYFVPPLFDMLTKEGFFLKEIEVLNKINREIKELENDETYLALKQTLQDDLHNSQLSINEQKKTMKDAKKERKRKRQEAEKKLSQQEFLIVNEELRKESLKYNYYFKDLNRFWNEKIEETTDKIAKYEIIPNELKAERKVKSNALQKKLFSKYIFLNINKEEKSLYDIFQETIQKVPPGGAGECAAPKLLQYAFIHGLKPISMAEFWWGQSPKSEIRKPGYFYPACRSKCEPILSHMLQGMDVDENPMLTNPAEGKELEIIFENDKMLVINKPAEFLSVPGINVEDSVFTRIKEQYPLATGPLIVHRIDMSTSGLLLISKTKEVNKFLQRQFINRNVKKRYVALLDGILKEDSGTIELPLRVDLDNRPHQLVCYEHGKLAVTKWEVIERIGNKTRVYFYPVTGRTHQLRVHAAHPLGLNAPIIGDDLYGIKADRLHLHAESITFKMPYNKEEVTFQLDPEF
jgi:tRNA pseudouridine32 synthase/23S rRNA pseudouridine746 synthase